jgi:hypothetical protein
MQSLMGSMQDSYMPVGVIPTTSERIMLLLGNKTGRYLQYHTYVPLLYTRRYSGPLTLRST